MQRVVIDYRAFARNKAFKIIQKDSYGEQDCSNFAYQQDTRPRVSNVAQNSNKKHLNHEVDPTPLKCLAA